MFRNASGELAACRKAIEIFAVECIPVNDSDADVAASFGRSGPVSSVPTRLDGRFAPCRFRFGSGHEGLGWIHLLEKTYPRKTCSYRFVRRRIHVGGTKDHTAFDNPAVDFSVSASDNRDKEGGKDDPKPMSLLDRGILRSGVARDLDWMVRRRIRTAADPVQRYGIQRSGCSIAAKTCCGGNRFAAR